MILLLSICVSYVLAIIGISTGLILWLVSYYAVSKPMEATYQTLTLGQKLASALLPNMGLYWAMQLIAEFELSGSFL